MADQDRNNQLTANLNRNKKWSKDGQYRTDLGDREAAFQKWVRDNKIPFDVANKGPDDYDMRGFWKGAQDGDPRANTAPNPNDGLIHYDDKWKTPYHTTFSSESQWATPAAPAWNDKDQLIDPSNGAIIYDERAPALKFADGGLVPSGRGSVNDYIIPSDEDPENAPSGSAGDFARALGAGTAGIGSNLAAASRYFYELAGSESGASISQGIQEIFGAAGDVASEGMNPETKKLAASALTSPEFWKHPVLATALKTTGMLPAVAALAIPGGLLADAVGATVAAGVGGGIINAGAGLDEFYKKLDGMSDTDLQGQSAKYKALREVFDETTARTRFNKEAQGWGPAINAVIGAAASVAGPAGTAARGLAGGAKNAVVGAGERGALGSALVGVGEGASGNAVQAGVSDATSQNAAIDAQLQEHFDAARTANATLEGGALGGLMGGAVGLVAGGKHAPEKAIDEPVPGKVTPPNTTGDVAPEAVSAGTAPPQRIGSATAPAAPPPTDAPIGNPQSAPTRSGTDGAKRPKGWKKGTESWSEPPAAIPVDPAIAAAVVAKGDIPTASPTEHAALTEGSPNATIDAINAGEQKKAAPQAEPTLDTGLNTPEKPASIAEQLKQIGTGDRKAVMLPRGTVVAGNIVPTGFKSTNTPRGRFIYDPKLTDAGKIQKLSRLGRENELLGLGPVSKPDAAARAAAGETPVAVTERTPDGTEVKAAAGTAGTVPEQRASLEAQKSPGNVIAVETPENVLQMRTAPAAPAAGGPPRTGRILPNLTTTAETQPLSDFNKNRVKPPKEPKGKHYSSKEFAAKDSKLEAAKAITDKHAPDPREDDYMRNPDARDAVIARANAMVADADAAGVKVQAQIKKSTKGDAPSDHPSIQILRAAKDLAEVASKRKAGREITEAAARFREDERLIRGGYSEEVIARRREEGDAAMRRAPEGGETAAATDVTPESELAKKEGAEVVSRDEASITPEGKADVEKDQVKTSVQGSAKGGVRGIDDGTEKRVVKSKSGHDEEVVAAKAASPGKTLSAEEKAAIAARMGITVKGAPARAPVKSKPVEAKPRMQFREHTDAELANDNIHPVAKKLTTLRRWANRLSDADYKRLEELGTYNFPRVMQDTLEPGRILAALKASLKEDKAIHLDPGDYDHVVDATAKEMAAAGKSDALRVNRNPTEAQKAAGNYKKGHRRVEGLDYTIENPRGAKRRGVDEHGEPWEVKMPADYGYLRGTEGADGDHIDAYDLRSGDKHFVVDQLDHKTGEFDEHKVMLRAKDEAHAVETYKAGFSDGKGEQRLGNLHELSAAELKDWLKTGDTKEPITKHALNVDRNLDNVNFDSEKPKGGGFRAPDGTIVHPEKTLTAEKALDRIDVNSIGGIGGTLARFFQSRLKKLTEGTNVHYIGDADMAKLSESAPGVGTAAGLHIRDMQGASHIFINKDALEKGSGPGSETHIVLHELIHAITVREVENVPGAEAVIRRLAKLTNDFMNSNEIELRLEHGEHYESLRYGLTNAKEFVAEAFSNPHFQELLARIPMPKDLAAHLGLEKKTMSMWDVFRGYVKKIIEKTTGAMPQFDSVLDGIMKVGEHLTAIHEKDYYRPRKEGREQAAQIVVQKEALHLVKDATEQVNKFLGRGDMQSGERAPLALKLRTFDNIAQIADHFFEGAKNPVRMVHEAVERMRVTGQKIFEQSEPIVRKMATLRSKNPAQFAEFSALLHDATVADVHPDVPLSDAKNAHLGKSRTVGTAVWAKAQHPDLAKRYNALSPELKEMWHQAVKHFTDTQNKMTLGIVNNQILKLMGVNDEALGGRIFDGTLTDADRALLGGNLDTIEAASELSKIEGPYVPLMRRGDHVVKADYKIQAPAGAKVLGPNEFEFKTDKEATDYAKASSLRTTIKKVWVDEKTGELHQIDPTTGKAHKMTADELDAVPRFRVEVQNRHVEFVEGRRAADARAAELALDPHMEVHKVVPREFEPDGRSAGDLSTALTALVKKLEKSDAYKEATPTQQATMRAAIHEAALASHGSTRVSSRALPRRGVAGYSEDLVQNTVTYAGSSSRYLAKLEHGADLEAGMKAMAEQLDRDHSKTGQYARTAISNEVQQRVLGDNGFQAGGKLAPVIKRALSVSFIDKLGSPAYSVINAMQPSMVTMPYLSGRHGVGRTFAAMAKAYADINAGRIIKQGLAETGRRIVGRGAPEDFLSSIVKKLSPDERAMINKQIELGTLDPSAGMEIMELVRSTSGVGGKIDTGLGYLEGVTREMPRAIEAINRAVTAIAAYRLERSRGAEHEAATQYAMDAVNNTQFNYSPTNSPALFNHPLLKVALQFKKYGQGIYQLIGSQIANAIRNETPGARKQAVKTLFLLAATHTAIAGALGLPTEPFKYLLMSAHAVGLTGMTWSDVEDKIRHEAASVFGNKAGEVITRGLPRLLNIDLGRAGLDSVTSFGEPKANKEADVKSWLFDSLAGPVVALGGDWLKGINQIANGDFEKAAESLIPLKAASDSLRAYRQATEGKKSAAGRQTMTPYTPTETALRVLGFGSGREAETGAASGAYYRQSARQKEERTAMVSAWTKAAPAEKSKAWAAVQKWNRDQPAEVRITPKELTAKAKRDATVAPKLVRGIAPNKRDKRFLAEGAIYNTGS